MAISRPTKIILGMIGLSGLGFGIYKLIKHSKKPYYKKTGKKSKEAVKRALIEFDIWNKPKTFVETDPERYNDLKRYWSGVNWNENQWSPGGDPWSAAFISRIFRDADYQNNFKYSALHSDYFIQARKNREQNNPNMVYAYRLHEYKPRIGDLICNARGNYSNVYDRDKNFYSHCDIVIDIDEKNNIATVIGGNVDDSVRKKRIPLQNGYVKSGNKRFATISTSRL